MFTSRSGIEREVPKEFLNQVKLLGYRFGDMLGKGGCGTTYRCHIEDPSGGSGSRSSTGEQMAVKHINLEKAYNPIFRAPQTSTEQRLLEQQKQREEDLLSSSAWRRLKARVGGVTKKEFKVEASPVNVDQLIAARHELETELKSFQRTNHPNVIRMHNSLIHEETRQGSKNPNPRHVLVFMELATGDLFTHIAWRTIPENESKNYASQMIRGIAHIHHEGIAHLDLKPENVLTFASPNAPFGVTLKITDFGFSMFMDPTKGGKTNQYFGGTPIYADPVITRLLDWAKKNRGQTVPQFDAYKADVWSVGIMVYQFIIGFVHFRMFFKPLHDKVLDPNVDIGQQLLADLRSKQPTEIFVNFLTHIVGLNQEDRISADECCKHQWLNDEVVNERQRIPSFSRQII